MSAPLLNRRCSVPNCPSKHVRNGYCQRHACQIDRHGRLTPERERGVRHPCGAPGCIRAGTLGIRYWRMRLCGRHWRQIHAHGQLTPEREHERHGPTCSVAGCPEPHRAKGFCVRHYNRMNARKGAA